MSHATMSAMEENPTDSSSSPSDLPKSSANGSSLNGSTATGATTSGSLRGAYAYSRGDFADEIGGFEYRSVPLCVPAAGAFVPLSLLAFLWEPLVIVPVIGIILGMIGLTQVRRNPEVYTGKTLSYGILTVLMLALVSSTSIFAYGYATEVPEGYHRVSFASEIAKKGFVTKDGKDETHPDVASLNGKQIMLKGYMYPTGKLAGLTEFVLCKDTGECCFGGKPKATDIVLVKMEPGKSAVFHDTALVYVAGEFETLPMTDASTLGAVYRLKAKFFGRAKTSY